jgi:hypothetical protein
VRQPPAPESPPRSRPRLQACRRTHHRPGHDDPHQLLVDVERCRDLSARREGRLGPDPDREAPGVPDRQCAACLEGRVRDVGGRVGGLTARRRRSEGRLGISLLDVDRSAPAGVSGRMGTQELFQIVVRWCVGRVPRATEVGEGQSRRDQVPSHDTGQRVRAHQDDVVTTFQGTGVEFSKRRAEDRRSQHHAIAQAANREVRDEASRARDDVSHPFGHVGRSCQVPVGASPHGRFAGDDLDPPQACLHRQPGPRVGRRLGERVAGVGHRPAPEGSHVVGAEIGVPHRQRDVGQRNTQFLGDQEAQRRAVVLSDIDFSRERGHLVVDVDVEPRARARRPATGRQGWRWQEHDETVTEHLEPVPVLGFGQVPGARGARRRILRIPE